MRKLFIAACVFVAIILLAGCGKSHKEQQAPLSEVNVARPVFDSVVIYKTYPGQLAANKEVDLVARVNGYILTKNYNSGDYVKAGTVLYTIESRNYRDAVARAQAALAEAQANREYAATRYKALSEALKGDAVSEIEVAQGKSNLAQCEAAVKDAAAALQTAQTQLSYCTVRAPFDGHVSSAVHDPGSYVAGEAAPVKLTTIYEDRIMLAAFSIEDNNALGTIRNYIADGTLDYNNIPLTFSESLKHKYTGKLDYLSPKISTSTGTMTMQAVVDNYDNELRSGMYVSVDLPVDKDSHAMLIKDAAIGTDQLGKYVYVVNDSDRIIYTPIEVANLVHDTMRIVTKGLAPDSRYVTKALLKVRDGMPVKPLEVK